MSVRRHAKSIGISSSSCWETQRKLAACGDYRRLSLVTEPDHCPPPNMANLTANLNRAMIFPKLDLLKGCFQVPCGAPRRCIQDRCHYPSGHIPSTTRRLVFEIQEPLLSASWMGFLETFPFAPATWTISLFFFQGHKWTYWTSSWVLDRLRDNSLVVRQDKCHLGVH